jgi:probable rRNA maturation factor
LLRVNIRNQVKGHAIDSRGLRAGVKAALALGDIDDGIVNVAIVDDPTIHEMNVRHLEHDYPTDVLSFLIEQDGNRIEGDIAVSIDTAAREAPKYGWQTDDELLLYVVHGALHLAGFDDLEPAKQQAMRAAEQQLLAEFGLRASYEERVATSSDPQPKTSNR